MNNYFVAIFIGAFAFYLVLTFFEFFKYKNLTRLEKISAQIDEEQKILSKITLLETLDKYFIKFGFKGITIPLVAIFTLIFTFIVSIFTLLNLNDIIGILIALPIALTIVLLFALSSKKKDEIRFRRQLLQAFGIIATQIESGDSINRAIQKTTLLVEDPLRRELELSLSKLVGSATLSVVLLDLSKKYPSKAIDMFLAALEIDELMGAKLAPILRQAQSVLETQFDLSSEATAEITQAKGEFYGISIVMILVAFGMFFSSTGLSREAYLSPVGIIILTFVFINYLAGVLRTILIFNKAKKGNL